MENELDEVEHGANYFVNTTHILAYCILTIGKQPHLIPEMTLPQLSAMDLSDDDIRIRQAIKEDLRLIVAMICGIYNNYNNYKDKSKFGEFCKSAVETIKYLAGNAWSFATKAGLL